MDMDNEIPVDIWLMEVVSARGRGLGPILSRNLKRVLTAPIRSPRGRRKRAMQYAERRAQSLQKVADKLVKLQTPAIPPRPGRSNYRKKPGIILINYVLDGDPENPDRKTEPEEPKVKHRKEYRRRQSVNGDHAGRKQIRKEDNEYTVEIEASLTKPATKPEMKPGKGKKAPQKRKRIVSSGSDDSDDEDYKPAVIERSLRARSKSITSSTPKKLPPQKSGKHAKENQAKEPHKKEPKGPKSATVGKTTISIPKTEARLLNAMIDNLSAESKLHTPHPPRSRRPAFAMPVYVPVISKTSASNTNSNKSSLCSGSGYDGSESNVSTISMPSRSSGCQPDSDKVGKEKEHKEEEEPSIDGSEDQQIQIKKLKSARPLGFLDKHFIRTRKCFLTRNLRKVAQVDWAWEGMPKRPKLDLSSQNYFAMDSETKTLKIASLEECVAQIVNHNLSDIFNPDGDPLSPCEEILKDPSNFIQDEEENEDVEILRDPRIFRREAENLDNAQRLN